MTANHSFQYKVTYTHFNEGCNPSTDCFPQLFDSYDSALEAVREDAMSWMNDSHDHFDEQNLTLHNDNHNDSIAWTITEVQA